MCYFLRQGLGGPVPRTRQLPPIENLLQALQEAGVEDAPREGPPEALQALLDMALYVAEHRKRVSFPSFSWDDPRFRVQDQKATLEVAYARLAHEGEGGLEEAVVRHLPRVRDGRTLLGVDATGTRLREYELVHLLYGEVTLFSFPHKPRASADPRIEAAREAGWVKTLKEHNLLPGRGMVVLDEQHGLLLTEPDLRGLLGVLVLYPTGETALHWNPFAAAEKNDPELQYWLSWGMGTGSASEWREMLHVERGEEE